jgi:hypothetical protein
LEVDALSSQSTELEFEKTAYTLVGFQREAMGKERTTAVEKVGREETRNDQI